MARVVLDADLLIAFLDPADAQHARAEPLLREHLAAGDELLVSASVYAEILVRPLQNGTDDVIDQFLAASGIRVLPVDRDLARAAAQRRAPIGSSPRRDVSRRRASERRRSHHLRRAAYASRRSDSLSSEDSN